MQHECLITVLETKGILSVIPLIIVGVMEAPDYICGISVDMLH